jgi:thiamine-monophosphate kinase
VISPALGHELVAKTDAIVAGVDFPPDDPPDLVARKALRVNLSDLAAKGAIPRAYMLDLILPNMIDEVWIAAFAAGLAQDQAEYGVHLTGGDMSSTPGPVTIAVMAFGEAPIGRIIRRGGARAGDAIFVTGTIGDAALGLAVLHGSMRKTDQGRSAFLVDRYRLPRPRSNLGPQLIGIASAAVDVSDGLVADLRHICSVSKLGAIIEASRVPLSDAARTAVTQNPKLLATVLTGGDDYEILFTAPSEATKIIAELSRSTGVPITRIGRMVTSSDDECNVSVIDVDGRPLALSSEGWTHF